MSDLYDVVIIGAGPAGSAAAHYLASRGHEVLLLDKFDFPRDKTCGDALSPRALAVLDDMDILDNLRLKGRRINMLAAVAPNGRPTVAPIPQAEGMPDYALIVPRLILDEAILERALASGAKFQSRIHVTDVEPGPNGVVVKGGRHGRSVSIRSRMAIIATGANIRLLLRMGLFRQTPPMAFAARSYFEDVSALNDQLTLRFDGVPLPGYGWVFPLPDSAANIGAGFFPSWLHARRRHATPRAVFENFIQIPPLKSILAGAQQKGPVKGYPLRVDFANAPTIANRVILVGEAAGLVNPITGEGIDYALESGKMGAEHLAWMFATGDLSSKHLLGYDRLLRQRYQRLFIFCNRMRALFFHRHFLNQLVKVSAYRTDLKMLLINVALGNQDLSSGVPRTAVLQALFALAAARFR